ncbi:GCN5-related N-acetyltransferase [Candidatus Sulfotelmatomonas gaucii]|uniref:GCN5-related N-acetyltransferase n=1 Tax=Candidatus Sulfuritelmatomonas gaucii TaxID=2043161 RepID=A0A2N9L7E6_9BACT|nr:GCN5-related N-acetyltransferase [Candidatus Sulfotelmatomonas gaucii]
MNIQVRACKGLDELEACVKIQVATWGYDESDAIPRKTFLLAQRIGGQVLGAFVTGFSNGLASGIAGSLCGFAMSLPGIKTIESRPYPYLHSHMLAVLESHRNLGLGTQLKWEQRREALSRGIRHMEWTFDPLEIKNAFLNIHRLGAIAREYRVDFYGVSSSRLQGGLPTDRLLAEWELDSPRVKAICAQRQAAATKIEERICVPASIDQWKTNEASRSRALAVQIENRQRFQEAFSRGLAVLGFSRDAEGNGVFELGSLASLKQQLFQDEDFYAN